MSDGSEKLSEPSESGSENGIASDICRDFLRNVCRRGKRCKYRHPGEPQSSECKKISEYTFCHDYQNNGCNRPNCKFLHCTREEEDHARLTGELPPRVVQAASIGIGVDHAEMVAKAEFLCVRTTLKVNVIEASSVNIDTYQVLSTSSYKDSPRAENMVVNQNHDLKDLMHLNRI